MGRWRWSAALALAALMIAKLGAAAPLQSIKECAAHAPGSITGIKALSAACPDLDRALQALGIDALLSDEWRDHLDVHSLADVAALVETSERLPTRALPDTTALAAILRTLNHQQPNASQTWWDGVTAWLRDWLAHSDSVIATWLRKLFDGATVSPSFLKFLAAALTAVLAALAISVVVVELKLSGVTRRRRTAKTAKLPTAAEALIIAGLIPGKARDELSDLLRSLVQQLLQTGRLKVERSLTHRELVERSILDDEAQRRAFAAVAQTAESAFYGPPSGATLAPVPVLEQGRLLLEQLQRLRSTP